MCNQTPINLKPCTLLQVQRTLIIFKDTSVSSRMFRETILSACAMISTLDSKDAQFIIGLIVMKIFCPQYYIDNSHPILIFTTELSLDICLSAFTATKLSESFAV